MCDPGERPPRDARHLEAELRRPDLAHLPDLLKDLRLVLGEGRLIRIRGRKSGRLHEQPDLVDLEPAAGLDLGGAESSLLALRVEHRVEDGVLEPPARERSVDRVG